MKIKSLMIQNFKGINTMFPVLQNVEKIEAILEPNGSGKTSFQEALNFLFTGALPGTVDETIYHDAQYSTVEGLIEMPSPTGIPRSVRITRELRRGKPTKVYINGKASTNKAFSKMIEDSIGISTDNAKKYISSKACLELFTDQKNFSAWLMSMLPVSKDKKDLIAYAGLSKYSEQKMLADLFPKDTGNDFSDLRKAYDTVIVDRKALKKVISTKQSAVAQINADLTAGGRTPSTRLIKEVERDLAALRNDTAQVEIYNHDLAAYQHAVANRKEAEEKLTELKKALSACGEIPTINETQLQRAEELIRKKEIALRNAEFVLKTAKNSIAKSEEFLSKLNEPVCPFSTEKVQLVCNTDKSPLKNEVEEQIKAEHEVIKIQEDIIAKANKAIKEAKEFIKKTNAEKARLEKIKALNKDYEFLKKHLPTIPEKPQEPKDSEKLKGKISALEAEKADIIQNEMLKKLNNEISEHSKELDILEMFANDILSPKGKLYSALFNAVSKPLTDHINDMMKKIYSSKTVEMEFDNGINIFVKDGTNKTTFANLSTSEKAIVLFGVQSFANALSPFNILFVDNVDKFDIQVLNNYIDMVSASSYDHVFFTGVNHDDTLNLFSNRNDCHVIKLQPLQ